MIYHKKHQNSYSSNNSNAYISACMQDRDTMFDSTIGFRGQGTQRNQPLTN
jgi:hypothetical protein